MSHCYLPSLSCIVSLCIFMIHYEQDDYCSHTPAPPGVEKQTSTDHVTVTKMLLKDVPANDSFGNYSISNEGRIDLYAWRFLWTIFHFRCWVVIPFDNKKELFPDPLFIIFTIINIPELRLLIQFLTDCWPSKCTDMLCNWKTSSTKCLFLNGAH